MPEFPDRDRPWWLLPQARVPAVWWLGIATAMLAIEYATGLHNQYPLVYFVPVCLAAWYSGRWPAIALAVGIPIAQLVFMVLDRHPVSLLYLITLTVFRGTVILITALWLARLSEYERALREEVQTLKGLLPICSFCKSIRNDSGEWEQLERYISRRSETEFSHGICPKCHAVHYADLIERERQRKRG